MADKDGCSFIHNGISPAEVRDHMTLYLEGDGADGHLSRLHSREKRPTG